MRANDKLYVHMGCGEALQSRWWVPRPVAVQPASGRDGKPKCERTQMTHVKRGVKCRA
jgi:hypothetical protein